MRILQEPSLKPLVPGFEAVQGLQRLVSGAVFKVRISDLRAADPPLRSDEDANHSQQLAQLSAVLQPVLVHRGTMRVIDGMHRIRALLLRGKSTVQAQFFEGDEEDAFVLAVERNTRDGLALPIADRRVAAVRIASAHAHWPDPVIAAVTGLTPGDVTSLRHSLASGDADGARQSVVRPYGPTLSAPPPASSVPYPQPGIRASEAPAVGPLPSCPIPRGSRGRRSRHDAPSLVAALSVDPTLRYTDSGRRLLRLLVANASLGRGAEHLASQVPAHCASAVALAARACATAWLTLADHVEGGR